MQAFEKNTVNVIRSKAQLSVQNDSMFVYQWDLSVANSELGTEIPRVVKGSFHSVLLVNIACS